MSNDHGEDDKRHYYTCDPALDDVAELPRDALIKAWKTAYRSPPPKGISRRLLEYAAAYNVQAKAEGGLKPGTKRKLHRQAQPRSGSAAKNHPTSRAGGLPPGSRLVREWHGRSHIVHVVEDGFLYDHHQFRSLSQVARAITGTRWSGPRFFGL